MTVGELIEELKNYDRRLPVIITWEGCLRETYLSGKPRGIEYVEGAVIIDGDGPPWDMVARQRRKIG